MNTEQQAQSTSTTKRSYTRHHEVTAFVVEQVFKLRAKGHTNDQIGAALRVPGYYVTRIYNGRWPMNPEIEALAQRLRNQKPAV